MGWDAESHDVTECALADEELATLRREKTHLRERAEKAERMNAEAEGAAAYCREVADRRGELLRRAREQILECIDAHSDECCRRNVGEPCGYADRLDAIRDDIARELDDRKEE